MNIFENCNFHKATSNHTQRKFNDKSVEELAQDLLELRIAIDRKLYREGYKFRCPITGEYVKSGTHIIKKYKETKDHFSSTVMNVSRKGYAQMKENFDPGGKFYNKRIRRGKMVEVNQ